MSYDDKRRPQVEKIDDKQQRRDKWNKKKRTKKRWSSTASIYGGTNERYTKEHDNHDEFYDYNDTDS